MKRALIFFLIIAAAILLLDCGGSPEAVAPNPPLPAPGPGTGNGPLLQITDEQRLAALKECRDFAGALPDLKLETTQQVLVAYLKSRPEFEDAGILHGNVWAYFYDGRIAMFIPDWLGKDPDGGRLPTPDISGGSVDNGRTDGLPEGKTVKLFHGLGNAYQDNRPYLANIFSKSHTQYRVQLKDATVENLQDVEDLDIFYINTHGGFGSMKPRSSGEITFALWTSDTLLSVLEYKYRELLNEFSLVYMLALEDLDENGKDVYEWHYAISGTFAEQYMSFGENSILYIDACSGLSPDASSFKDPMMSAAKNDQTTYIGWSSFSDQATGFPTSRFVFDRFLGAQVFMPERPGQRPFDLSPIFDDFPRYNLGISGFGGHLGYQSASQTEVILTPSIEYIGINELESKMYIKGLFGDRDANEREVTVGGVKASIEQWTSNLIVCAIPTTGFGSHGNVFVSVGGNDSNIVPISEWVIPLELIKEDMGGKMEVHLKLRLRADVHPYRSKLGEAPKKERPDTLGLGDFEWPFNAGSMGTYNVGGSWTETCVFEKCQITQTASFLNKQGSIPYTNFGDGLKFDAYYNWSADMKTLSVKLFVKVPNVGFEYKMSALCEGKSLPSKNQSRNEEITMQTDVDFPVLQFHLDENYKIKPGQVVNTKTARWEYCIEDVTLTTSAKWPEVSTPFPPKNDTHARMGGE